MFFSSFFCWKHTEAVHQTTEWTTKVQVQDKLRQTKSGKNPSFSLWRQSVTKKKQDDVELAKWVPSSREAAVPVGKIQQKYTFFVFLIKKQKDASPTFWAKESALLVHEFLNSKNSCVLFCHNLNEKQGKNLREVSSRYRYEGPPW